MKDRKDNNRSYHKKRKKAVWIICLIVIGVIIILLNNYDIFFSNFSVNNVFISSVVKRFFYKGGKIVAPESKYIYIDSIKNVNLHQNINKTIDSEFIKSETLLTIDKAEEKRVEHIVGGEISTKLYSLSLQNIRCRVQNREDIILNLSLELFFEDIDIKQEILMKREEIKIMVMNEIKEMELADIKPTFLESHLIYSINSIFDKKIIKRINVKTIEIEKAVGK